MTTNSMDATGVRSTGSSSVASFLNICMTAEKNSSLTLIGHMSGDAYLSALANSVCEYTGVDISCWGLGSQFNISARGADKLPTGLLAPSFQHLSKTCAADFFGESDSLDTYFYSRTAQMNMSTAVAPRRRRFTLSKILLPAPSACLKLLFPSRRRET